jgi:hypothetical protein
VTKQSVQWALSGALVVSAGPALGTNDLSAAAGCAGAGTVCDGGDTALTPPGTSIRRDESDAATNRYETVEPGYGCGRLTKQCAFPDLTDPSAESVLQKRTLGRDGHRR